MRNSVILKFLVLLICISIIPIDFGTANEDVDSKDKKECFGFIITYSEGKNTKEETFEITRVNNLINDLLRLNLSVYRAKKDFAVYSENIFFNQTKERNFQRGSYIIPFTGTDFTDSLIVSVIYDYNQTHELDSEEQSNTKTYLLLEQKNIECDRLIEPKIAQYHGKSVRYNWPSYFEIAEAGGFLNYDFLLKDELKDELNNNNYNIFIWPYKSDDATYLGVLFSIVNSRNTNIIRKFVRNGGGYIGTCLGAYFASSGYIVPGLTNRVRLSYFFNENKILPGFSFSISDTVMKINPKALFNLYRVKIDIIKPEHPLFYAVNSTYVDFLSSPLFAWVGKNSEVLAVFSDIETTDGKKVSDKRLRNAVINNPSWINSKFGKGEVILFTTHPDFVNNIPPLFEDTNWPGDPYHGRRLIHNSFFYTTSEKNISPDFIYKISKKEILNIYNKTKNIQINSKEIDEFNDIILKLNKYKKDTERLNQIIKNTDELYLKFLENNTYFPDSYRFISYSLYLTNKSIYYINQTVSILQNIENISGMLLKYNPNINKKLDLLNINISKKISNAKNIFSKVNSLAQKINSTLSKKRISIIDKILFIKNRRNFLNTYEIQLKYIPQIFFESKKLERNLWYEYEASISLDI